MRTHAENVWGVQVNAGRITLGQSIQSGQMIGRKNALNLAVWLLRAIGATRDELDSAMAQAIEGCPWQGFRAQFGDDER